MTSSLVGSEMCIRDSTRIKMEAFTLGERVTTPPGIRLKGYPVVSEAPVSYTHLTLPTICSV
eukprot:5934516-Prorocentrum_lima.AAC.1